MIYFCSDLHFYHDNLIKYCERPCSKENHNEWILSHFKDVQENDVVYHLGDFTGRKQKYHELLDIFKQLPGQWKFILGNHDNENQLKSLCNEIGKHEVLGDYKKIVLNNRKFILFHYPIESWDCKKYGSIMLHGHVHNTKSTRDIPNRFNICLDNEFKIYTLNEILEKSSC